MREAGTFQGEVRFVSWVLGIGFLVSWGLVCILQFIIAQFLCDIEWLFWPAAYSFLFLLYSDDFTIRFFLLEDFRAQHVLDKCPWSSNQFVTRSLAFGCWFDSPVFNKIFVCALTRGWIWKLDLFSALSTISLVPCSGRPPGEIHFEETTARQRINRWEINWQIRLRSTLGWAMDLIMGQPKNGPWSTYWPNNIKFLRLRPGRGRWVARFLVHKLGFSKLSQWFWALPARPKKYGLCTKYKLCRARPKNLWALKRPAHDYGLWRCRHHGIGLHRVGPIWLGFIEVGP